MATIGFIGTGNMGGAIARAVCKAVDPQSVILANRTPAKAEKLARELGCRCGSNEEAAACDWVFLGVKPFLLEDVLAGLQSALKNRESKPVLVSMAAAQSIAAVRQMAGGDYPTVRLLPNTPCAIGAGMTQYIADGLTDEQLAFFKMIMAPSGRLDEIEERLADVCGVMGCGPAYTYMFIEALADGAVACGMPRDKAMEYSAQMMVGAAQMVLQTGMHPGALKDAVCSPAGSTIQGVRTLEEHGFRGAVTDAFIASYEKTMKMGKK